MTATQTVFRPPRLAVRATSRHAVDEMSRGRRRALIDACYRIYRESSRSLDRAEFGRRFFAPGTRVGLFHGDGELAGFSNARVLDVPLLDVPLRDAPQRVFSAGVYFRLRYRGGREAARFGFSEALREKIRQPHLPLAYVCMASNPAVYRLHHQLARRVWPHPDAAAPAGLPAALDALITARGLEPVAGDPWRVRSFVRPDDPGRLRRSRGLRGCAAARFFEQRNPGWADPNDPTALLLWVPLDPADIAVGLRRATLRAVGRSR